MRRRDALSVISPPPARLKLKVRRPHVRVGRARRPPKDPGAAIRKQEQRVRDALQLKMPRIPLNWHRMVDALTQPGGRLTEAEALDPAKVIAELAQVLEEWAAQWLGHRKK